MYAECVETLNSDERLVHSGRHLEAKVLVVSGEAEELMMVSKGRISVETGPFVTPGCDFAIVAAPATWEEFLAPEPGPGRNDIFALLRNGLVDIYGDVHPFFANLQFFKDVLAAPRRTGRQS